MLLLMDRRVWRGVVTAVMGWGGRAAAEGRQGLDGRKKPWTTAVAATRRSSCSLDMGVCCR